MRLIDITGQKFGRLTVIAKRPPRPSAMGGSSWLCRCECGIEVVRVGSSLRRSVTQGSIPSCGCYQDEWASFMGANPEFIEKRAEKMVKHGGKRNHAGTPEYKTWLGMKARCYRQSSKDYPSWGGKGIGVCERWRSDFSAFLVDMGQKPTPYHTIDRLDPTKDYSPENCRWATEQQQGSENRSGFVSITVRGQRFNKIADACRFFGVSPTTVNERLRAGVPPDEAFAPGRLKPRRTRESYLRKSAR